MNECDSGFHPGHPASPQPTNGTHAHTHTHKPLAGEGTTSTTATTFYRRRLVIVVAITLSVVAIQLVGALWSGSLALLADAGHMLTDATGVGIALGATYLAALPASKTRTFGFLRVEIFAALINGLVLCVVAIIVLVEALRRIGSPAEIEPGIMLIAASVGALANLISLLLLRTGQRESLNVRGAYLEVLGDLLGSFAVIVAAIVIWITDWAWVDQAASIVIALLILPRAVSLLRDVAEVLLEATPRGLDTAQIRLHLSSIPGVSEVHDLHAWTITSGVLALSAHLTVDADELNAANHHAVLDEAKNCLRLHFGVDHSTLQLEPRGHRRVGIHSHS